MKFALELGEMSTKLLPEPCEFAVLAPEKSADNLPLLYFLHGGGGSRDFLQQMRAPLETAMNSGELAPVVVATPSAGMSYYMDAHDGSQRWETLLVNDLRAELARRYPVDDARTLVTGVSMGGVGSLRLAFRNPSVFLGVASLEAGVDPFLKLSDMPDWYASSKDARLGSKFGDPIDEAFWAANNPANIAAADPQRLIDSGMKIMLEVGTDDGLFNHHNVEFLHRVLFDHGIKHEYRTVLGANHIGASITGRVRAALRFLDRVLDPAPPDPVADNFSRSVLEGMRKAGIEPPPF